MARKYEFGPGRYAWNPEKCEEVILIAGYDDVARFIAPDQTWKIEFENHFFDHGNGLSLEFLDQINAVRKRRGLEPITVSETDVYDYARSIDKQLKATHRQRIREELRNASLDLRQGRVALAKAEAERLPAPHLTYDEYKAKRARFGTESQLSFEEVTKRVSARENAMNATPAPAKVSVDVDKAAKALTLASPALRSEIITMVPADDALEVAERVADPELRDALVKRSFGC